jgi:hypothetical protein
MLKASDHVCCGSSWRDTATSQCCGPHALMYCLHPPMHHCPALAPHMAGAHGYRHLATLAGRSPADVSLSASAHHTVPQHVQQHRTPSPPQPTCRRQRQRALVEAARSGVVLALPQLLGPARSSLTCSLVTPAGTVAWHTIRVVPGQGCRITGGSDPKVLKQAPCCGSAGQVLGG